MTVAVISPINSYVGNGGASSFAFTFPVFLSSQVLVTVVYTSTGATTTLVLGTDYNVTGLNASGDPASTGTVALINSSQAWLSAGNLATGYTLVVQCSFALSQTTSIRNQGDFYRSALENALDTLEYQIQQLQLEIGSQLVLPTGILPSAFSPILPSGLAGSPGLAIVVNSTGTGLALGAGSSVTLPVSVAQGGTGSQAVLAGNRVMKSSGQTIIEAAAITASRALASDANGIPVASTVTSAQLALIAALTGYVQAAGTVAASDSLLQAIDKLGALGIAAKAHLAGTQSIGNSAVTVLGADVTDYDTNSGFSGSGTTFKYTAPFAGKYRISATASFAASATGTRTIYARVNGATDNILNETDNLPASTSYCHGCSTFNLALNDTIAVAVFQNSGGNLAVGLSFVSIERVGP